MMWSEPSFAAQIKENRYGYRMVVDVTGASHSDVTVEAGWNHLAISIRRNHSLGSYQGSSQRQFSLPDGLDVAHMSVRHIGDQLEINIPKARSGHEVRV